MMLMPGRELSEREDAIFSDWGKEVGRYCGVVSLVNVKW